MGEIRIVGPGKTRGSPYPVCKNNLYKVKDKKNQKRKKENNNEEKKTELELNRHLAQATAIISILVLYLKKTNKTILFLSFCYQLYVLQSAVSTIRHFIVTDTKPGDWHGLAGLNIRHVFSFEGLMVTNHTHW